MAKFDKLNDKYKNYLLPKNFNTGELYRAVSIDGDIYDGVLTFDSDTTVELMQGDSFRTFNKGLTRFVKLSNLAGE